MLINIVSKIKNFDIGSSFCHFDQYKYRAGSVLMKINKTFADSCKSRWIFSLLLFFEKPIMKGQRVMLS